jgi:malate dehydrogenase (oxaloacetate-decarboxylating)(NADP+)
LRQLRSKSSGIEKHLYLAQLRQTNVKLFYALGTILFFAIMIAQVLTHKVVLTVEDNLLEITPLIYTPVVGEMCERYSELYT